LKADFAANIVKEFDFVDERVWNFFVSANVILIK